MTILADLYSTIPDFAEADFLDQRQSAADATDHDHPVFDDVTDQITTGTPATEHDRIDQAWEIPLDDDHDR